MVVQDEQDPLRCHARPRISGPPMAPRSRPRITAHAALPPRGHRSELPRARGARCSARWREHDVFHETLRRREGAPLYVFYEGPPTANGAPGAHHVLSRVFKDIFPRYKTMRGFHVPRKAGWDCHGLPVELEVERQLGITLQARDREVRHRGVQPALPRVGVLLRRGVEPAHGADRVLDRPRRRLRDARERVHRVGLVGAEADLGRGPALRGPQGRARTARAAGPRCPRTRWRSATTTSSTRRSTCASRSREPRGPLAGGDALLIWTTTPWTLVSNAAVAVDPELDVRARAARRRGAACWPTRASSRCSARSAEVLDRFPRQRDRRHRATSRRSRSSRRRSTARAAHTVLAADFVSADDGTGLVHTAIAFGEDDFRLGEQYGLNVVNPVRPDGTYDERIGPYAGRFVKDADPDLIADLEARGLLFRAEEYEHAYPHCWRCDTPLLYYAKASWYIRTTARKRRAADGQRGDRVVPVPHQARALRQVAREQRRLGAVARALLGHAAAGLALRGGARPLRRLDRRAARAGAATSRRTCTGPTSTTSRSRAPSAARRCDACRR